jgi:hypothetical protein
MVKRRKTVRNIALAKQSQKQIVNVFTKPPQRRSLARNSQPMIRTIYQHVPIFNPIPYQPQPVGTAAANQVYVHNKVNEMAKTHAESHARLNESLDAQRLLLQTLKTPQTVSFNNRDPHPRDDLSTVKRIHTRPFPGFEPSGAETDLRREFNYIADQARTEERMPDGGGGAIKHNK